MINVDVLPTGLLRIGPPRPKPDVIEFRAEMDLIVGLTACSAEMSNHYRSSRSNIRFCPRKTGIKRRPAMELWEYHPAPFISRSLFWWLGC